MTPQHLAVTATADGRDKCLSCWYNWNHSRRRFEWQFFRRGVYIGATCDPSKVLKKMESFK